QREAVERGQKLLNTDRDSVVRPVELEQEIAAATQPRGEMVGPSAVPLRLQQANRAELDRIVGVNANDPLALQRALKGEGDWNRLKMRTLHGEEPANRVMSAVDRE